MKKRYFLLLLNIILCSAIYPQSFKHFEIKEERFRFIILKHKLDTIVVESNCLKIEGLPYTSEVGYYLGRDNIKNVKDALWCTMAKLPNNIRLQLKQSEPRSISIVLYTTAKGEIPKVEFWISNKEQVLTEEQLLKIYDAVRNIKFKFDFRGYDYTEEEITGHMISFHDLNLSTQWLKYDE